MIVFEPKRINQWQSRFVPSGIIYGRMGRTMRNYGLRIIARPENKPPFTSRKKISPRIFRSRMMSMSIFVKISVMNAEESPESQAMKSTAWLLTSLSVIPSWNCRAKATSVWTFTNFEENKPTQWFPGYSAELPDSSQCLSAIHSYGQYRRMDVAACQWRRKHLCFRLWRPLPSDGYEATYRPVRGTVADLWPERQYTNPATIAGWCGDDRFRIHLCGEPSRVAFRFRDGLSVCLWYERESGPDGANGLDMTYNRLNLIEKVTRDGRLLANFSYLSNGRKYLKSSDDGHGLCYVGYW